MQFIMKEFGLRITKLRIERGYTQERLADALNVDRTHISKLEAGTRACSIDLIIQLAAFFGVSLDYLILGKKEVSHNSSIAADVERAISLLIEIREHI